MRPVLFLVALCSSLFCTETWEPHNHPATLTRTLTAYTRPQAVMTLSSEVQGRIESVTIDEGDAVSEKPPITIDSTLAAITAQQATALVNQTLAEKERQQVVIAQLEREATHAERERERNVPLFRSGKLSATNYEAIVLDADRARLRVSEAQAYLKVLTSMMAVRQAELDHANEMVQRHQVQAPKGWIVTQRHAYAGDTANPNQPLLELADLSRLTIPLRLSTSELQGLLSMTNLAVTFPQGEVVPVIVKRIGVRHDPNTRKRLVELDLAGECPCCQWWHTGFDYARRCQIFLPLFKYPNRLRPVNWNNTSCTITKEIVTC